MTVRNARVFLSHYGELGWGLSSPELRGLVGGVGDLAEWTPEAIHELAVEAGLDPVGAIVVIMQQVFDVDGEVFQVRIRHDYGVVTRAPVAEQVIQLVAGKKDLRDELPRDTVGDATFVVCNPDDSIGAAAEATDYGEITTLVMPARGRLQFLPILHNPSAGADGTGRTITELGLDLNSSITDLFGSVAPEDDDASTRVEPLLVVA